MKIIAFVMISMTAFAANSVLNRAGVFTFGMDPLGFAGVRLISGAAMLMVMLGLRGRWPQINSARFAGAGVLLLYLIPFSLAYVSLPSGIGALILFGVVQITMFAGSAMGGVRPSARQWGGMGVAMAGLGWLLWPNEASDLGAWGVACMALSGFGWGLFSLKGRGSMDPLGDIALSFILAVPIAAVLVVLGSDWSTGGIAMAVVSGAITSGLGYAVWYRVLPQIAATTGSVAQLSVPVIAIIAGAVLLSEIITFDIAVASVVVLGGIAVAVLKRS